MGYNAVAQAPPKTLGGSAIKPPGWDRTGFEAFRYMIYNPETGEIFTRTPKSWLQITAFYIVYYSLLAAFWLVCLQIFFLTLPEGKPRWTLDGSLIGSNPGVGVRPSNRDARIDSSIFLLETAAKDTTPTDKNGEGDKNADWARRMEIFMEKYSNNSGLFDCSQDAQGKEGKCMFDTSVLGDCASYPYGYFLQEGNKYIKPCIFLKFNKIWNWIPKPIDAATLDEPKYDMMTDRLKNQIRSAPDSNYVWMDCRGRNPADQEALAITYFPDNQGIPIKYFPYSGGNYQAPLVAVRVETDKILDLQVGQLIHVECRAWFDGVIHDTKDMAGLVRFEVMLRG